MSDRASDRQPGLRVFCSYARDDDRYRGELGQHMATLLSSGAIDQHWDDREILPGDKWDEEIKKNLDEFDIFIFLLSSSLVASSYCTSTEFRRALERGDEGAWIVPVLVRDFDLSGTEFGELQVIPKAPNGRLKAVNQWQHRDSAWKIVTIAIRKYAEAHGFNGRGAAPGESGHSEHQDSLRVRARPPRIFGKMPRRVDRLFGRERFIEESLRPALDLPGRPPVVLIGPGGSGKSATAVEYAHRNSGRYDLIAWIRSENPDTLGWDLAATADRLDLPTTDQNSAKAAMKAWLARNDNWLLIFDNATDYSAIEAFLPNPLNGSVIVSSREPLQADVAVQLSLDQIPLSDAAELLLQESGTDDRAAARDLAWRLAFLPLALNQAASLIRQDHLSIREYIDRFDFFEERRRQ